MSAKFADVFCCKGSGCSGGDHVSNTQLSAVMWHGAL